MADFRKLDPNFQNLKNFKKDKVYIEFLLRELEFCFIYDSFNILNDLIEETPIVIENYMFKKLYLDIMIAFQTSVFNIFGGRNKIAESLKFKGLGITKVAFEER